MRECSRANGISYDAWRLELMELLMMSRLARLLSVVALVVLLAGSADAAHRIALQGNGKLAIVEKDGEITWQMKWGGIHDIHVLANGHIMVQQGSRKVVEIDPKTKKVVWSYDSGTANGNKGKRIEVHAFQPLANGRIMIAESGARRIIEINRAGKILHSVKLHVHKPHPHRDTRLVRKIPGGNYLVCHEGDGAVREYDGKSGKVVWEYDVGRVPRHPRAGQRAHHGRAVQPQGFRDRSEDEEGCLDAGPFCRFRQFGAQLTIARRRRQRDPLILSTTRAHRVSVVVNGRGRRCS